MIRAPRNLFRGVSVSGPGGRVRAGPLAPPPCGEGSAWSGRRVRL